MAPPGWDEIESAPYTEGEQRKAVALEIGLRQWLKLAAVTLAAAAILVAGLVHFAPGEPTTPDQRRQMMLEFTCRYRDADCRDHVEQAIRHHQVGK